MNEYMFINVQHELVVKWSTSLPNFLDVLLFFLLFFFFWERWGGGGNKTGVQMSLNARSLFQITVL